MADTTATLGIEVKSTGAKEAAQDLDKLTTSAAKAAQATKGLGGTNAGTNALTSDLKALNQTVPATTQSMTFFQRITQSLGGMFGQTTSATHAFRDAIHTLDPVLVSAGAGMGNLGAFAMAARAGIVGLGIAIAGGLAAAIESGADKLKALNQRLVDVGAGKKAFAEISAAASRTGQDLSALESIAESLSLAIQRGSTVKWVGDFEATATAVGKLSAVIGDMARASRSDISAVSSAFEGMRKDGKLTLDVFDAIQKASPGVARMIAEAFNQSNIETFRQSLAQTPKTANELAAALTRIGPAAKASADQVETMGSALGRLKASWDHLVEAFDNAGISTAINSLADAINAIVDSTSREVAAIAQMVNGLISLGQAAKQVIAEVQAGRASMATTGFLSGGTPLNLNGPSFDASGLANTDMMGNFATGGSFTVGGDGGTDTTPVKFMATKGEVVTITPAGLQTPKGMSGASPTIGGGSSFMDVGGGAADNWQGGAAAPASAITNPIVSAVNRSASTIANAVGGIAGAIGGAVGYSIPGGTPQQSTVPFYPFGRAGTAGAPLGSGPVDAYGNVVTPFQYSYVTRINHNSAIAGSAPGGSGQMVYAINPNYGQFATGGSFIVGGSGGMDTSPVNFMATPGERVTVTPPGQASSGGADVSALAKEIGKSVTSAMAEYLPRLGKRIGKDNRPIVFNFPNNVSPQAFMAAEAQMRRTIRRAF